MPYDGNGVYNPLPFPVFPAVPGELVLASQYNEQIQDMADSLTQAVTRDGQSPATADLPMGGFRHSNVGPATSPTQYARVQEILQGAYSNLISVAGTADAITGNTTFPFGPLSEGQMFSFTPLADNTGAATLEVNSLDPVAIKRYDGSALEAGDIAEGQVIWVVYTQGEFRLVYAYNVLASLQQQIDDLEADKQDAITDNSLPVVKLDVENGTEIGAGLADNDKFIVDRAAAPGSSKVSLVSRIWAYIQTKLVGVTIAGAGDGSPALTLSGNNSTGSFNNSLHFLDTDVTLGTNQPYGEIAFFSSDADQSAKAAFITARALGSTGGSRIEFGAAAASSPAAPIFGLGPLGQIAPGGGTGYGNAGQLLVSGGANASAAWLGSGTSGRFLRSNGSGSNPSFVAISEYPFPGIVSVNASDTNITKENHLGKIFRGPGSTNRELNLDTEANSGWVNGDYFYVLAGSSGGPSAGILLLNPQPGVSTLNNGTATVTLSGGGGYKLFRITLLNSNVWVITE